MSEKRNASPPEQTSQPTTPDSSSNPPFPVVGLGASAGGLRALQRFFEQMPAESGMAFVVIVHLSPEHESHLPMLLQAYTTMPVIQATETISLEPNRVYVIPPNRNLSTIDTHLRVSPLEESRSERAPIDYFFRTLASTHDSKAIGIVLSGTGSDGALGLRSIQEVGGLTVAQAPEDAEYNSMPQSAINSGAVELVLAAEQMPAKLLEYVQSASTVPVPSDGEELPEDARDLVQKILTQVRAYSGHDFSRYKNSTIMRRIRRRMQVHGFDRLNDYLGFLREHSEEIQALFADFLITVTNFFRDPEAFASLEREVIPSLFQDKGPDDQVRVWVIGCATGEEAYSIGMLLLEYANQLDRPPSVQIFATDLSEEALRRGREGLYSEAISIDVSAARLARFFVKEQGGYRVRQELREIVLFAPHSLLKDPPFSKLDLITCRNVLIYLQRNVQQQLFELFHYSLRLNGYLFLGSAETIEGSQLFRDVNRRYCIFQRQPVGPREVRLPTLPLQISTLRVPTEAQPADRQSITSYEGLHVRLMEQYAPPSLVVNADYNIVYFSEGVTRYLHQPRGEPTNNLLRRVREELRVDLTTGLYRAFERGEASQSKSIPVRFNGSIRSVTIDIRPAVDSNLKGFVLVLFLEHEYEPDDEERKLVNHRTLNTLEEELQGVRKRLQTTIEEYETSKEEMKAANEELQSMNEELRSTAEELETSKEELQSINEELLTVNQENKNKIEELSQLTSDLQNLLVATDIATLFLDRDLRIKRFTPRVSELFNVLATDRGRPLAHITHKLVDEDLLQDASAVLRTLMPVKRDVRSEEGRIYVMRLLPYRTVDDRIDGLVVTFVDITDQKRVENTLRESELAQSQPTLHTVLVTLSEGVAIIDGPPRYSLKLVNGHWLELIGRSLEEVGQIADQAEALRIFARQDGERPKPEQLPFYRAVRNGEVITNEPWRIERSDGEKVLVHCNARPISDAAGQISGAVLCWHEVTE
ncbi:MAG: CheR family methyltransferase [Caldilineaceae bacterium]